MGSRNSNVIITNEELLGAVPMVASALLSDGIQSFQAQPGSTLMFPWLSALAGNFQSYSFRKLVFHYKPSCPTSTAGIVALAFDPDPSNSAPSTLQSLSAMRERVTGSAWTSLTLVVPPKALSALSGRKMIRTDSQAIPLSSRPQFDCGTFHAYAGSGSVLPLCGLLYVSYSVELFVPQPPEGGSSSICSFTNEAGADFHHPFGTAPRAVGNLGVIGQITDANTTVFFFPRPGRYLLSSAIELRGTSGNDTSYIWDTPFGLSVISLAVAIDGTFAVFQSRLVLEVLSQDASIQLHYATPGTGLTTAVLTVVWSSSPLPIPS